MSGVVPVVVEVKDFSPVQRRRNSGSVSGLCQFSNRQRAMPEPSSSYFRPSSFVTIQFLQHLQKAFAALDSRVEEELHLRCKAQVEAVRQMIPEKAGGVVQCVHLVACGLFVIPNGRDENFRVSQIVTHFDARDVEVCQTRVIHLALTQETDFLMNALADPRGAIASHSLTHFHLLIKFQLVTWLEIAKAFEHHTAFVSFGDFFDILGKTFE